MAPWIPILSFIFILFSSSPAIAANFTCNSVTKCQSLIGYVSLNGTTIAAVSSTFQVPHLSLLAANNLPLSTPPTQPVAAGAAFKVPMPCACSGGAGTTDKVPVYTVKAGDTLDAIAVNLFSRMVTNQEIGIANNIPDVNKIFPGQKLQIPLPCSCDDVGGAPKVHLAHIVVSGSSLAGIAEEFGTTQDTLMRLNRITDPKKLQAGQTIDVPLRACFSVISNTTVDSNLRVPNGSYALTANNCVRCSCSASTYQLDCHPTHGLSSSSCPVVKCGGLFIGNTTSSSGCNRTVCAYKGFTNNTRLVIQANLTTLNFCPKTDSSAPAPSPSGSATLPPPPSSGSATLPPPPPSRAHRLGLNWLQILVLLQTLVCVIII